MAKNSRRAAAAIATVLPSLAGLDSLPPLKSLAVTIFFDKDGDFTNRPPRYDLRTNKEHLTETPAPSS